MIWGRFFNIDIPVPRFQRSKIYIAVLCNIYVWFQHYHLAPPLAQLTCIFFKVRLVVLIYLVFSLLGLNIQQQQKKNIKSGPLTLCSPFCLAESRVPWVPLGPCECSSFFPCEELPTLCSLFRIFFWEWGNLLNYHDQNLNIGIIKGHCFFCHSMVLSRVTHWPLKQNRMNMSERYLPANLQGNFVKLHDFF